MEAIELYYKIENIFTFIGLGILALVVLFWLAVAVYLWWNGAFCDSNSNKRKRKDKRR